MLELECNLSLNLKEELDISDCGEFKLEWSNSSFFKCNYSYEFEVSNYLFGDLDYELNVSNFLFLGDLDSCKSKEEEVEVSNLF